MTSYGYQRILDSPCARRLRRLPHHRLGGERPPDQHDDHPAADSLGAVVAYRRRGRRLWVKRCELAEPVDAANADRPEGELTAAEAAQWLAAFDQSAQRHAEQLAKRHGIPFPDSALDIAAARAERSAVRQ
ncbi:MAG: hypothetical protein R3B97_06150 [Dehalococcoidia bacterium]